MSRLTTLDTPIFYAGEPAAFAVVYFGNPNTDPTAVDGLGEYTNEKEPYTDRALSTATTAQITLDSGGKFPNRLFLSGSYSITAKTEGGVQIFAIPSYEGESTDTIGDDSDYAGADLTETLNTIKAGLDAVTATAIINIVYPVGSIYSSYVSTSPATTFGVGTWVQVAQGRALAGVGEGTDQNAVNKALSAGNNAGSYQHILTTAQLASHVHLMRDYYYPEAIYGFAANKELFPVGYNGNIGSGDTDTDNTYAYYIDHNTNSAGGGEAHENMIPTYAVYIWRRTA